VGTGGLLVVGGARLVRVLQPGRPDRDLGRRRPATAVRRAAGQLSPRRRRPLATVDGGTARRPERSHRRGRRVVDDPVRAGARRRRRPGRRPALGAPGHRPAEAGPGRGCGAGGRPVRVLGRRRPRPHRIHLDRRRRPGRRAQHPAAGRARGQGCGDRPGLYGARSGAGRPALGRCTGRRGREERTHLAGGPPGPVPAVGRGVRRDSVSARDAAGRGRPVRDRRPGARLRGHRHARRCGGRRAGRHAAGRARVRRRVRGAGTRRGAGPERGPARGLPPGAQPRRVAGVGDRTADGHGAGRALPAVRQRADTRPGCGCSARRWGGAWRRPPCSRCRR
jgi:hypothetical protein